MAITWFAQGCRHGTMLWQRLQREMPETLAETIRIADSYALGDPMQPSLMPDEPRRDDRRNDRPDPRNSNKRKDDRPEYRSHNQVAVVGVEEPSGSGHRAQRPKYEGKKNQYQEGSRKMTYEMMLDQPCSFHSQMQGKPAGHTTRQCTWMHRAAKEGVQNRNANPRAAGGDGPLTGVNLTAVNNAPRYNTNRDIIPGGSSNNNNGNNQRNSGGSGNAGQGDRNMFQEHHQAYCVFITEPTDRVSTKRREREVHAVIPAVPRYLNWSEHEISWSRKDHPKVMPSPGEYALVIDPTFLGPTLNVKFTKVLVDNGSSINIMYVDTMHKLGLTKNMLQTTNVVFHGILPGVSCQPMGKVRVDLLFGTKENYRIENIEFEVVDLESPYHALLGRPALAKFMASTQIAYLKMKIPGPNGEIIISGDYKRSLECATACSNLAETLLIAEEKKKIKQAVTLAQAAQKPIPVAVGLPAMTNPSGTVAFKPAEETKTVPVDAAFPERTVMIGAGLAGK
jgi:hypothetical protein